MLRFSLAAGTIFHTVGTITALPLHSGVLPDPNDFHLPFLRTVSAEEGFVPYQGFSDGVAGWKTPKDLWSEDPTMTSMNFLQATMASSMPLAEFLRQTDSSSEDIAAVCSVPSLKDGLRCFSTQTYDEMLGPKGPDGAADDHVGQLKTHGVKPTGKNPKQGAGGANVATYRDEEVGFLGRDELHEQSMISIVLIEDDGGKICTISIPSS